MYKYKSQVRVDCWPNEFWVFVSWFLFFCFLVFAFPLGFACPPASSFPHNTMSSDDAAAAPAVWSAEGMTQEDFMLKDQCILLDMDDNVIGYDNK